MILITGAAGKTGKAVIQALVAKGESVRALVYREEHIPTLKALGVEEIIIGDLIDRTTVDNASMGVRAVYHICPNMSPDEIMIGRFVIDAAGALGIEHLVYHSVLHPQTESMPHHWFKLRLEELLVESGVPFTILQPTAYMQNILSHWNSIYNAGIFPVPYSVEARSSLVDLQDVAQVAAAVLTAGGHIGATYELVGVESISQTEIADTLSSKLGRTVKAQEIPHADWERGARASGLGDYQVETLIKMFEFYGQHSFVGNSNVLRWLLDREPTTFESFVDRENPINAV
ncbi:MAG: NmrA family NAD(P)-binding protein [Anaerolineales bacterium]|nr:NmrA family NAD(P)-binding protein [Chloroflexota bacterium]MBL6982787.1 NmrA family NAD(P)-binding protein [Anaerolineales bacterium]